MTDEIVTQRLRTLAEGSDDDYPPTGDTVELEEMQLIETADLKQLRRPRGRAGLDLGFIFRVFGQI